MKPSTEALIARLAAEAGPVRRLPSPWTRAGAWLAVILAAGAAAALLFGDTRMLEGAGLRGGLAWAAALATGCAGVVAAAHLAMPDRSRRWALAPLPPLALWIALSGVGCIGLPPSSPGESDQCFVFILAVGAPLGAFLFWRLRRARPLDPRGTAFAGALGAAGLSAALLQFFHPMAVTWLDLGTHLAAVAVILAAGALAARPSLAPA